MSERTLSTEVVERAVKLSASGLKGYVALVRALPDSLRAGAVAVRLTAWIRTEGAGRVSMWVHLITSSNTIASNDSAGRWPEGDTGWTRNVHPDYRPGPGHRTWRLILTPLPGA